MPNEILTWNCLNFYLSLCQLRPTSWVYETAIVLCLWTSTGCRCPTLGTLCVKAPAICYRSRSTGTTTTTSVTTVFTLLLSASYFIVYSAGLLSMPNPEQGGNLLRNKLLTNTLKQGFKCPSFTKHEIVASFHFANISSYTSLYYRFLSFTAYYAHLSQYANLDPEGKFAV